jgi:hypothetical protein
MRLCDGATLGDISGHVLNASQRLHGIADKRNISKAKRLVDEFFEQ